MLETEPTVNDARALLWSTLAANVVVLLVKVAYIVFAQCPVDVYVWIMCSVTIANVLSLAMARARPIGAVTRFACVSYIGIVAMLLVDAVYEYNTFPTLANVLPIICIGTAYVLGLRRSIPFIVAVIGALGWLLSIYGPGEAIVPLSVSAIGGVLVGRLRDELDRIRQRAEISEGAIETYVRIHNGG